MKVAVFLIVAAATVALAQVDIGVLLRQPTNITSFQLHFSMTLSRIKKTQKLAALLALCLLLLFPYTSSYGFWKKAALSTAAFK